MESFLLFCNTALMLLVVALTLVDERRKPGKPRTSPFRISEKLLARDVKHREPVAPDKRRRRVPPR